MTTTSGAQHVFCREVRPRFKKHKSFPRTKGRKPVVSYLQQCGLGVLFWVYSRSLPGAIGRMIPAWIASGGTQGTSPVPWIIASCALDRGISASPTPKTTKLKQMTPGGRIFGPRSHPQLGRADIGKGPPGSGNGVRGAAGCGHRHF